MVEVGLLALADAHFEVDGVAHNVHFRRLQVIEEVAVVPVVVTYRVLVLRESLVHQLLVIDVTFLHAELVAQVVGRGYGIAHPSNIADIVLLAFFQFYQDVDMLFVHIPYGVFEDGHVTVAQLVVLLNKGFLSLSVAFVGKLLGLEHGLELASLVNLSEGALAEERALDLLVAQVLVALEDDAANLHLLLLVDGDIEYDLVLIGHIVALHDVDFGILVAL